MKRRLPKDAKYAPSRTILHRWVSAAKRATHKRERRESHEDVVARLLEGMTGGENFEGHGGYCGEHRTVGPHRAWCFQCTEWCYPEAPCKGCAHKIGAEWP